MTTDQPRDGGLELLLQNINRSAEPADRPANAYVDPATGELLGNSPSSDVVVATEGLAKVLPFRPRGNTGQND